MLVTLCVTVITGWGVLYYALPVLAGDIAADTGWSTTGIIAALSASQLVAAAAGVPIGRWLDQHGPRGVMTAGSALAVFALMAVASAPTLWWFIGAWSVAGVAMGATLYSPAFSAVTRWHGPNRVRALTTLTLVGGLASTVFAPLTALLADSLDWRGTFLVLAAILGAITIPAHWFGLRLPWPPRPEAEPRHADPGRISRSREFVTLTVAFSVAAFATSAVVINLIPLLAERGIDTATAAMALGLGGAGQVAGRLGYGVLARHTTPRTRTAAILAAMAVTTVVLGVLTTVAALIGAAILAGVARGVFTLIKATAVSDRWGSAHYGRLSGVLAAPLTVCTALAPFAGAALAEAVGGYSTAFVILGAVTLVGALLALATSGATLKDA